MSVSRIRFIVRCNRAQANRAAGGKVSQSVFFLGTQVNRIESRRVESSRVVPFGVNKLRHDARFQFHEASHNRNAITM